MSLLIEALKQAEARKAKLAAEQAAREAQPTPAAPGPDGSATATAAVMPAAGAAPERPALELEPIEVAPAMDGPSPEAGEGAPLSAPVDRFEAMAEPEGTAGPSLPHAGAGHAASTGAAARDSTGSDEAIPPTDGTPPPEVAGVEGHRLPASHDPHAEDAGSGTLVDGASSGPRAATHDAAFAADAMRAHEGRTAESADDAAPDPAASGQAAHALHGDAAAAASASNAEGRLTAGSTGMEPSQAAPAAASDSSPGARNASPFAAAPRMASAAPASADDSLARARAGLSASNGPVQAGPAADPAQAAAASGRADPARAPISPQRQAQAVFEAGAGRPRPTRRVAGIAVAVTAAMLAGGAWLLLDHLADAPLGPPPVAAPASATIEPPGAPAGVATGTPPADPMADAGDLPDAGASPTGTPDASARIPAEGAAATRAGAAPPAARSAAGTAGTPDRRASPARTRTAATPAAAVRPEAGDDPRAPRFRRGASVADPMQRGYEALQAGRLDAARGYYLQALRQAPRHPDALLGLAAIAERQGDVGAATAGYRQVLRVEPNQPVALAALAELESAADPYAAESGLRSALADRPDAAPLHFALGNRMAGAGRWSEAQQAYFQAFALDSGNADYAFNLAVALDRLHKPALAAEHYRRALALAGGGAAHGFDVAGAKRRLAQLGGTP